MEIDRSIDRWSVDVGVVRARAPPFLCRGVLQVGLGLHRRRSPWERRALALADLKFGEVRFEKIAILGLQTLTTREFATPSE